MFIPTKELHLWMHQSGFKSYCSKETVLIKVVNYCTTGLWSGMCLVFLNFNVAFDAIDHTILFVLFVYVCSFLCCFTFPSPALTTYNLSTLLKISTRTSYLSSEGTHDSPTWPKEIIHDVDPNNGNKPPWKCSNKKNQEKRARAQNRLRVGAHPLFHRDMDLCWIMPFIQLKYSQCFALGKNRAEEFTKS